MPRTNTFPKSCIDHLRNLDRYMAASGHGEDHPWRMEIVNAIEAEARVGVIVDDITSAAEMVENLLALAVVMVVDTADAFKLEAAIRAARRYNGDVISHADRLTASAVDAKIGGAA